MDTFLVLFIDIAKTVLACFIGGWILGAYDPAWIEEGQMFCGGFSVIGHIFPIYFGFRGGKGILTCATVAAFMGWQIILILLGIFIIVVVLTRYVSLGSIISCVAYPFLFWWRFYRTPMLVIMSVCLAAIAIAMHHTNIKRLIHGKESKFSFHRKAQAKSGDQTEK
jgi:glycerol-3-phosphate acyltransferase PlsY